MSLPLSPSQPLNTKAGRAVGILSVLLTLLILLCAARLFIGSSYFGWPHDTDILQGRLVRMICAVLIGAMLAVSGVALQALLRNPLAEPFILGLSSGAGVGVMAQTLMARTPFMLAIGVTGLASRQVMAMIGAGVSMLIVFLAGRRRGAVDPLGLLLVGVVLGAMNGAAILVMQYFADSNQIAAVSRWMMGWLDESTSAVSIVFAVATLSAGIGVMAWQGRAMDVSTFSDAEAESLGVNLRALRGMLLAVAGVLTATSVVLAGPVSFVGLIAPHLSRLMVGPSHRKLVLCSAMTGAMLILLADGCAACLALLSPLGWMPLGVFTALLGGPVFIWMLRSRLGRGMD